MGTILQQDIGTLDRWVTLRVPTEVEQRGGSIKLTYADGDSIWMNKKYGNKGSEEEESMRVTAFSTAVFTGRYRSDINKRYRLSEGGREWKVRASEILGRDEYIRLYCELQE